METSPTPHTVLSARGLTRIYGRGPARVEALVDVDLDLTAGTFTSIMGPSGSGKSTLLHCLSGMDRPTSGTVVLENTVLTGLNDKALTLLRRERIGFVFQAFNLLPTHDVRTNITLPLRLAGRRANKAQLAELTDRLGVSDMLDRLPGTLSGGQMQRVAIARALITSPALLVADEPTGNLDSASSAEVLQLLRTCADEGQTVLMVTHDADAAAHGDRIITVRDGRIESDREVR